MKKYIVLASMIAILIGPIYAFADHATTHTIEQLQAQIGVLQEQLKALQRQVSDLLQKVVQQQASQPLSATAPTSEVGPISHPLPPIPTPKPATTCRKTVINPYSNPNSTASVYIKSVAALLEGGTNGDILVISPNGGEVWVKEAINTAYDSRTHKTIRWSGAGSKIIYLWDTRCSFENGAGMMAGVSGSVDQITIPIFSTLFGLGELGGINSYKIVVASFSEGVAVAADASDGAFSIVVR